MPKTFATFVILLLLSGVAWGKCSSEPSLGAPTFTAKVNATEVCHSGYAAFVDNDAKVPRWVAYELTGEHTLGCFQRKNNFHTDPVLPNGANSQDYAKTGYDKGHQAPAEDFDWSAEEMSDSFSMANMAPQVPGLNRQQWERLEASVRSWAVLRGTVMLYVGPVLVDGGKTIGKHKVAVPVGFWKVVYDPAKNEALAFYMKNVLIAKGPLAPYMVSLATVEKLAGFKLPLPASVNTEDTPPLWPVDIAGWTRQHQAACRK